MNLNAVLPNHCRQQDIRCYTDQAWSNIKCFYCRHNVKPNYEASRNCFWVNSVHCPNFKSKFSAKCLIFNSDDVNIPREYVVVEGGAREKRDGSASCSRDESSSKRCICISNLFKCTTFCNTSHRQTQLDCYLIRVGSNQYLAPKNSES